MAAHNQVVGGSPAAQLQSWVSCDKCSKWRRIPAALADSLEDDAQWFCEHNPDTAHNNCDIPQELTDAEIDQLNAEQEKEAAGGTGPAGAPRQQHKRPPVWQLITSNVYTHRERKVCNEDSIMVCNCPKIWATDITTVGCGPDCLNRVLNTECDEEYCPSGSRCSNQRFTRREYAKLEVKRAASKGFGLFAAEDLQEGQFLIEYLGEVLEEEEYHRRNEYFIETGQRHYYFMNVGNGEVIDASRRGNLGRFINHSCEPNCMTEKWVIGGTGGEVAIGLFTMKDVAAGTELTFDYNFERQGDKPTKCLCGSKLCKGYIGGPQDKEGIAAVRAAIAAAASEPEPEPDPEFIMVTEKEKDAALSAILDRVVGLGWEKGWTPKLSDRLHKLAARHGVDLANISDDDEEGGALVPAVSSGLSDDERGGAAGAAAAAAATKRRQQQQQQRKPATARKARKPAARQRKPVAADESDWEAEQSAASSGSDESEEPAASGSSGSDSDGDRREAAAGRAAARAARQSNAQAAARAAAALVGTADMPFRRRLKRFARVAAAETGIASPAGSTGSQPHHQQQGQGQQQPPRRLGSATGSKTAQSVASSTPGGSSLPLIPKRSSSLVAPSERAGMPKRRSEIDRRLAELVNTSGRLRETSPDIIIRVLRLFNLCDIGPTVGKIQADTDSQQQRPGSGSGGSGGGGGGGGGPQRSDGSAPHTALHQNGSASDLAVSGGHHHESGCSLHRLAQQGGSAAATAAAAAAAGREEGEVSPEPERSVQQPPHFQHFQRRHSASDWEPRPPQHEGVQPQSHGSPGKDRRAEVSSRVKAAWAEAQRSGHLSVRQSARIADLSLLLDVVLKTNTLSAKKEFIRCGILRQLLGVVGSNTGKQYSVILKKVLRVVESLPLTPDDMHHTRSAHGSFADLLRELAQSTDFEIRSTAYGMLKKFPVQGCTRPLLPDGALHSSAGSSRSRAPPASMLSSPVAGGGPGLPPPPAAQWREGPPAALLSPGGGPPPPAHWRDGPPPPHMAGLPPSHDGFRQRDMMPPSRFAPGRGPALLPHQGPGGRLGPMGRPFPPPPPPHMQYPAHHPHHGPPPPHHHFLQQQQQQHAAGPPVRLPPPLPPGPPHSSGGGYSGGTPGGGAANGGSSRAAAAAAASESGGGGGGGGGGLPGSAAGSSRKRSRWDQPNQPAGGSLQEEAAGAGSPRDARTPRALMPPGFGGGTGDGEQQQQQQQQHHHDAPPSKRAANGVHGGGNGGGEATAFADLAAAPSWDVETQFAVGTLGRSSSYLVAAGSDANLSPDGGAGGGAAAALSYSPVASGGGGGGGNLSPPGQGQPSAATRPASAAHSHVAPSSGSAGGGDGRYASNGGGGSGGGMHLSPMSEMSEEEGEDAPPPPGVPPLQQDHQQGQQDQQQQDQQRDQQDQHEEQLEGGSAAQSWDTPDAPFAAFVADMVRRRVGKYAQPDHPMSLSQQEAAQLYSKIRREIVAKEQQAYDARQAAGAFKPIERGKLEIKIREFVRESIRRYHERRSSF